MSKTALVTGATSGIGAAFAQRLASEKTNLVIVARDEAKLASTAEELGNQGIDVETITADLATSAGVALVENRLKSTDKPIDLLINNAGFGLKGAFIGSDIRDHQKLIDVNITAVVRLTHAALPNMVGVENAGVINISSVAGFTPGLRPSSTYAATKAFVTAFTEGLAQTVRRDGIHMTAVCPGFVKSDFHNRAGINMSKLPGFLWLTPDEVVKVALDDHRKGKVLCVPGWQYKFIVGATHLAPQSLQNVVARYVSRRAS